eukprot:CAMPEP_0185909566 /NCGR_PEP_ID=MMETSP0196C-20130402/13464_1 /TAXON_ID=2932 /ORGANISM="Alexandrium fundyense, Strain CCMP1719" /LENGTH=47 /DNA_ID= /DNA_START= /DNA_END= /DNA_ORIENTATION=
MTSSAYWIFSSPTVPSSSPSPATRRATVGVRRVGAIRRGLPVKNAGE